MDRLNQQQLQNILKASELTDGNQCVDYSSENGMESYPEWESMPNGEHNEGKVYNNEGD